jgi:hypothetical protein
MIGRIRYLPLSACVVTKNMLMIQTPSMDKEEIIWITEKGSDRELQKIALSKRIIIFLYT